VLENYQLKRQELQQAKKKKKNDRKLTVVNKEKCIGVATPA